MIGSTFSHYEILRPLGSGGMGVVYEALDRNLGRSVAIKILPETDFGGHEARSRFAREARAASALNHPHICVVHELGEHEGQPFIVMEHMHGTTLAERLRGGPLGHEEIARLARQITDALGAAHAADIVHRDIKPANLFITDRGDAKILDFGLAKVGSALTPAESLDPDAATLGPEHMTAPGTPMGTTAYMSPEQILGGAVDARSDIFSLGVVLYEMATGMLPFTGATAAAVWNEVLNVTPASAHDRDPAISQELSSIISRCLEKSPEQRYTSADALLADLRQLASGSFVTAASEASMSSKSTRHTGRLLLAIGIVAIATAGVWMMISQRGPVPAAAKTIAVLPFENVSPDEADAYFATGVHEDVMMRLAGLQSLRVISKTSVVNVQREHGTLVEIGRRLGATYIVEGSVRRAENQVRVTAKLIDAETDETLWSDSYQRELANSLELQSEIALEIVRAMGARVSRTEQDRLETVPTVVIAAYDSYLAAHKIIGDPRSSLDDLRQAIAYLEDSTTADPNFLDGWGLLSETYTDCAGAFAGLDGREAELTEALEGARAALGRAKALDPNDASTLRAEGYILEAEGDRVGAVRAYDRALASRPNDTMILQFQAQLYFDLGQTANASDCLERAYVLDSNNRRIVFGLGYMYEAAGRYADMVPFLLRLHELDPSLTHLEVKAAYYQFLADGSLDSYRRFEDALATVERSEKCDVRSVQDLELTVALLNDDFDHYTDLWEGKWDRHHAGHGNWSCPGQINDEANHARLLRGFEREALADSIIARAQVSSARPYNDRAVCMFNRAAYQPKLDYLSGDAELARNQIDEAVANLMGVEAFPRGAVERQVLLESVDLVAPERVYAVYRQVAEHPQTLTRMEVICAHPWTFPNLLRDERFVAEVRADGRFVEYLEHFELLGERQG